RRRSPRPRAARARARWWSCRRRAPVSTSSATTATAGGRSSTWSRRSPPRAAREGPVAKKLAFDRVLFTAVVLLVGLGLVMVYSASTPMARAQGSALNPFLVKQMVAAAVGFLAM